MDRPQHLECDTPDCVHWEDGKCTKETSTTIQEYHCGDSEERITLAAATVTIEVKDGMVLNAYASPDLPEINIELIDFDNLKDADEEERAYAQQVLDMTRIHHKRIF